MLFKPSLVTYATCYWLCILHIMINRLLFSQTFGCHLCNMLLTLYTMFYFCRMTFLNISGGLTVLTLKCMLFLRDLWFFQRYPCWESRVLLLWVLCYNSLSDAYSGDLINCRIMPCYFVVLGHDVMSFIIRFQVQPFEHDCHAVSNISIAKNTFSSLTFRWFNC